MPLCQTDILFKNRGVPKTTYSADCSFRKTMSLNGIIGFLLFPFSWLLVESSYFARFRSDTQLFFIDAMELMSELGLRLEFHEDRPASPVKVIQLLLILSLRGPDAVLYQ